MKGVLKILRKLPPLFAIPTTAGTGSEATLAAVVPNSETHEKYAIMDTILIPHFAVLHPLVGYVHAIAHTLGGFYSVPHGLANAIILPYVLEYYGDSVQKPLAELADVIGNADPENSIAQNAEKFIAAIKNLNERLDIPKKVNGIVESDIPVMVERAFAEANPLYPVPRILNKDDLFQRYQLIKE